MKETNVSKVSSDEKDEHLNKTGIKKRCLWMMDFVFKCKIRSMIFGEPFSSLGRLQL